MPCRDYQSDWGSRTPSDKEKIDSLAAMLCAACATLENTDIGLQALQGKPYGGELLEWWENHKESDRREATLKEEAIRKQRMITRINRCLRCEEITLINQLAGHTIL